MKKWQLAEEEGGEERRRKAEEKFSSCINSDLNMEGEGWLLVWLHCTAKVWRGLLLGHGGLSGEEIFTCPIPITEVEQLWSGRDVRLRYA